MPNGVPGGGFMLELTWAPLFRDQGIALALMGISVVFVALVLIATLIAALPRLLSWIPSSADAEQKKMALDGEMPEELVVVIAAAVAAVMQRPHRIVRVRGLSPGDLGWSLERRMQHHHSHQLKHPGRK